MLGFLLRLLPFWVREPLFIVVGAVFGVRILYLAATGDGGWAAAGIGLVFLVFTAVRVHTVVRALRARRSGGGPSDVDANADADANAVAAPDAAVPPRTPAPAALHPAPAVREKEPNAWGQAFAAVAVFAALGAPVWLAPHLSSAEADSTPPAVSCPSGADEEVPSAYPKTPAAVTGGELCEALNRPDLAQLLRTPGETATSASGTSNTAPLTDGKVAQPEAEVRFDTYTVNFSATYNKLSIAQYVDLMKFGQETDVRRVTVLGRPAVLASDHTMRIEIDLGSGASGGPVERGPLARTLSVALDSGDRGGYYDITVWSTSGAFPDDGVLLDLAEKVLPTLPRS